MDSEQQQENPQMDSEQQHHNQQMDSEQQHENQQMDSEHQQHNQQMDSEHQQHYQQIDSENQQENQQMVSESQQQHQQQQQQYSDQHVQQESATAGARSAVITDQEIHKIASQIKGSDMLLFADKYLHLTSAEIENAAGGRMQLISHIHPGNVQMKLRDYIKAGFTLWSNRHADKDVVHLVELLESAVQDGVVEVDVLEVVGSASQVHDVLYHNLYHSFTQTQWDKFHSQYLHITKSEIEARMPVRMGDVELANVAILQRWKNKNAERATLQTLEHLLAVAAVEEGMDRVTMVMKNGTLSTGFPSIEVLSEQLKSHYRQEHKTMEPLYWESISEGFSMHEHYITLTVQQRDERKLGRENRYKKKIMSMNDIFVQGTSSPDTRSTYARLIVIEGVPGSGKTCLCKKFAYDWALGEDGIQKLTQFSMVFVIQLNQIEPRQSISECIAKNLLLNMKTVSSLKHILEDSSEPVLLVLDGYDELRYKCDDLQRIFSGQYLSRVTVLLTTRPGVATNLIKKADMLLKIENLNDRQISWFSSNYSDTNKVKQIFTSGNVKSHPLRPFVTTPLNLMFICMLGEKLSGDDIYTQTQLYEAITAAMLSKAADRLEISEEQVNKEFDDLCQKAFLCSKMDKLEFINKGKTAFTETQSMLGFTNSYYKRDALTTQHVHMFNHKSLHEYLTAKYIVTSEEPYQLVQQIPELLNYSRLYASLTPFFIAGLLAEAGATSSVQEFFDHLIYPAVDHISRNNLSSKHYGLRCLVECESCVQDLTDTSRLLAGNSRAVKVTTDCTPLCVRGLGLLKDAITQRRGKIFVTSCSAFPDALDFTTQQMFSPGLIHSVVMRDDAEFVHCYGDEVGCFAVPELYIPRITANREGNKLPSDKVKPAIQNLVRFAYQTKYLFLYEHKSEVVLDALLELSSEEREKIQWGDMKVLDKNNQDREMGCKLKKLLPECVTVEVK